MGEECRINFALFAKLSIENEMEDDIELDLLQSQEGEDPGRTEMSRGPGDLDEEGKLLAL